MGTNITHSQTRKEREKRDQFKNLKFLIIDEFSMLKSDMLYQLDLRLRELKQCNRVFGDVSVFLFGDPAQLPAVRGRAAYEKPIEVEYHLAYGDGSESLWRNFQAIFLTENHRQGNDQTYAEVLNRIRVGEQTEVDVDLLRTRVRPKNHLDLKNGMYIVCERAEAHEHNVKLLNELAGKLHEVEAKIMCAMRKDYKPWLKPDGTIQDTNFANKLEFKIGARVMLIHNVDVSDLLCNGALGILIGVETSQNGSLEKLVVKFDMPNAGKASRDQHPGYAKKYPEGTVITKMDKEYTLSSHANTSGASTARLIQYPLVLAYAVTVHKIQGQTIEKPSKICVDLRRVRNGGQAYVALSRIKELEQLFILEELPAHKMYPNHKALDEIKRLEEISINNNPTSWDKVKTHGVTKICFLNVRSLLNKFDNIKSDINLYQSDFMILAETWIPENTLEAKHYQLRDRESHLNNSGRGRGLAIFYKQDIKHIEDQNEENINISKVVTEDIDIIAVYRSREGCLKTLL